MIRTIPTIPIGSTARVATVLVVAGALVAGAASAPAMADGTTPPTHRTLAEIQALAKTKTDARITALGKSIAKITAAKDLIDSDRAAILGTLNADVAGMNTLEARIAGDTGAATAATDYHTIFTTYRVYAVAIPQSRFAAAADRITSTTIPRLTDAQSRLSADLAGKDASKSTPALQADLAHMTAALASASGSLSGIAARSLAVTPAGFNADHTVLSGIRTSVTGAIANVRNARSNGKTVLAALR